MKTKIQIICYAGLQMFFAQCVQIEIQLPGPYNTIIQELKKINPEANEVLDRSRIAANKRFVSLNELKTTSEPVYLVPPADGILIS